MTLNRDQILEVNDLTLEEVQVPEWGGSVLVRTMSGAARDAFDADLVSEGVDGKQKYDASNISTKLLIRTVVDESGNALFSPSDLEALGRKSSAAIGRVFAVASRLNLVGAAGEAAAAKNSASDQSSDSGISSPATSENPSESASAT